MTAQAEARPPAGAVTAVVAAAAVAAIVTRGVPVAGAEIPAALYVVVLAAGAAASGHLRRASTGDTRLTRLAAVAVFVLAAVQMARSSSGSDADTYRQLAGPLLVGELLLLCTWLTPTRLRIALAMSLAAQLAASITLPVGTAGQGLLVWGGCAAWALATLEHAAVEETPALSAQPRAAGPRRRALDVATLLALAASVALVVAAVDPRVATANGSRLGDDPAGDASSPYLGFTDRLDTSRRGSLGEEIVLRIEAPAPDFWRGESFDRWDGSTWTRSPGPAGEPIASVGPAGYVALGVGDPAPSGNTFVQRVHVEAPVIGTVFGAYRMEQVDLPVSGTEARGFVGADGSVGLLTPLGRGSQYTVISDRPLVTAESLRADDPRRSRIPPPIGEWYLQLPDVPARVTDLARDVTAGAGSTYDAVLALEGWMGANTTYTLDIPPLPPGADAVEQFLFVDKRGFCEQIASSLAVMLRSIGVPARVAVGFVPGDESLVGGEFTVRASDAHAWVEVWFPHSGWHAFDPTASVPLSGDQDTSVAGRLRDLIDRLGGYLLALAAALVLLAVGAVTVLVVRRRRARRARPWAAVALERLAGVGAARGHPRAAHQTPAEYGASLAVALEAPQLVTVGAIVTEAAWSPRAPEPAATALVDDVLRRARRRARR